jgi:hypothetical protein
MGQPKARSPAHLLGSNSPDDPTARSSVDIAAAASPFVEDDGEAHLLRRPELGSYWFGRLYLGRNLRLHS